IGEVSLSGGVRRVRRLEARVREAARLGFARVGVPRVQAAEVADAGIEVVPLEGVRQAFELLLEGAPAEAGARGGESPAVSPQPEAGKPARRRPSPEVART